MKYCSTFFLAVLMAAIALPVEARTRTRVNVSSLDNDPVASFPLPVLFGNNYDRLVPDFADSRDGGTRSHEGQDIRAPQGTPVVSPTKAVVLSTGEGTSAGKYVYTANPGGETFRYMHLDTIADISRGDDLEPGDLIGTVGDTGNAPDGVYHLHFEVRDESNDPTDPYPRLSDTFTIKEKASFLRGILSSISGSDDKYAAFLVATFRDDIAAMLQAGHDLPYQIDDVIRSGPVGETLVLQARLAEVMNLIPTVLPTDLKIGDQGVAVSLLQTYLIFHGSGPAYDVLRRAGATGYYGAVTEAAVSEYQRAARIAVSGLFDPATKKHMLAP